MISTTWFIFLGIDNNASKSEPTKYDKNSYPFHQTNFVHEELFDIAMRRRNFVSDINRQ